MLPISAERSLAPNPAVKQLVTAAVALQVKMLRIAFALRRLGTEALAALVNRRVPNRLKITAVIATLLIVSPLNILGDIPLLGIVDDAGLLSLVLMWFTRASAPYLNTIDV